MAKQNPEKTVLILENDRDLANSIRLYLEETYQVYIIQEPSQLLQYISKYNIQLLVTDLDYPYPNFQQLLHYIKGKRPDIKIVIMYMFLDEDKYHSESILKDADDFIFKPFDADMLKCKLDRLMSPVKSTNISQQVRH